MIAFFTFLWRFLKAFFRGLQEPEFRALAFFSFITVSSGTFFYHNVEKWNWLDSIYFSVMTLTTVGYGDISPKTNIGKVFTIFFVLLGLGILLGFVNLMGKFLLKSNEHDKKFHYLTRNNNTMQFSQSRESYRRGIVPGKSRGRR